MAFERILFRATRGNVFVRQTALENPVTDPASGEKVIILMSFPFSMVMGFSDFKDDIFHKLSSHVSQRAYTNSLH